jgi:SAM-dependent methyltransferase
MMAFVDDTARRALRAGFGLAAGDFDRTRPVCPDELFDDLVRLAPLRPGDRVVEIGCGTGQATLPLASRGLAVTAVELSGELAGMARHKLARFTSATVVIAPFEDWAPPPVAFDAVVAVSSLHWVDPGFRYAKPYRLLRPGGTLAVAECLWARPRNAGSFWTEIQADYRAVGYEGSPPPPPEQLGPPHLPAEAGAFFSETASLRYPFEVSYSAASYLALLATQSSTRALGEARAADFLSRVRRRLEAHGWPDLTVTFVGHLVLGERRERRGRGSIQGVPHW